MRVLFVFYSCSMILHFIFTSFSLIILSEKFQ
nr:MAG TPA: hypothetical protein [Caudoviricetes sp.]